MSNANSARAFRDLHQSGLLTLPNVFTLPFFGIDRILI